MYQVPFSFSDSSTIIWPWYSPVSCMVLSGLFKCSYVLNMYLFHSRTSSPSCTLKRFLISFSMVSERGLTHYYFSLRHDVWLCSFEVFNCEVLRYIAEWIESMGTFISAKFLWIQIISPFTICIGVYVKLLWILWSFNHHGGYQQGINIFRPTYISMLFNTFHWLKPVVFIIKYQVWFLLICNSSTLASDWVHRPTFQRGCLCLCVFVCACVQTSTDIEHLQTA